VGVRVCKGTVTREVCAAKVCSASNRTYNVNRQHFFKTQFRIATVKVVVHQPTASSKQNKAHSLPVPE
jgi:hypothetical protein